MIITSPEIFPQLRDKTLFLDTTCFNAALNNFDFADFLIKIRGNGCALMTIPSVYFEFTRGAKNLPDYNKRIGFLKETANTYPVERHLDELSDFTPVYQKVSSTASYTDFLLAACLYKFQDAFVITENHRDFPTTILDRQYLITIDTGTDLRNHGIYTLSQERFRKAAENILKTL